MADPVEQASRDTIRSPPPDMPLEGETMPSATITQCDLCPAVTDNVRKFCIVKLTTVSPWDGNGQEYRELQADSVLCPKCAGPILAFQRATTTVDGEQTDEARRERTKRLNERILSALKKTE